METTKPRLHVNEMHYGTSPDVINSIQHHWEAHARHRLAQFRASYGQFAGDPW